MPQTAKGLRYPSLNDPANGPVAVQQLAEDVEGRLTTPRYVGMIARLGTSADYVANQNVQTVTAFQTGIVNRAAKIDAQWYGWTLTGTTADRVLIRLWRGPGLSGTVLGQQYLNITDAGGPAFGGSMIALDTSPGVSPTYTLTANRVGTAGTMKLVGPTSGNAAIIVVQQLGELF